MFVVGGIPIKDVCGRCEIIEREWFFISLLSVYCNFFLILVQDESYISCIFVMIGCCCTIE